MKFQSCRAAVLAMVVTLGGFLTSCSKTPKWFVGTYEFDAAETMKPLTEKAGGSKAKDDKKDDGLMGLATAMAPLALVQAFQGATMSVTDGEMVMTKGGSGKVVKFEIYQVPDANTVVLKTSENKIETWIRTPTGIAQKADAPVDIVLPFKRRTR